MRFTERGEIDSTSYAEKLRKVTLQFWVYKHVYAYIYSSYCCQDLLYRQQMCECPPPADWQGPKEVEEYHSLCPLEESHIPNQVVYGLASTDTANALSIPCSWLVSCLPTRVPAIEQWATKIVNYTAWEDFTVSSKVVVLWAYLISVSDFRLSTARAAQEADKWRSLPRHANVVPLVEMFTTKAFGDRCNALILTALLQWLFVHFSSALVFVFEFISTAKPIAKECFNPPWFGRLLGLQ